MTQSVSPSEASLCQTSRTEWQSRRTAWTASWWQLLAGNCKTAKFICLFATEVTEENKMKFSACYVSLWLINLFNLQFVIFNHRVAQQLVRGLIERLAC